MSTSGGADSPTDTANNTATDGNTATDSDSNTESGTDTDTDTDGDTGGSGWYPGVPYPTDDLPAGIMPALPTPGGQPGWPYDPMMIKNPTPTGAANEYVVATTGDDGTAGNGGNGTMAAPRRTIPTGQFGAGTKIFVIGVNSPYGTVDFDIGDDADFQFSCTEADPCFWIGIDRPRIGRRALVANSAHVVLDGFSLVDIPNGDRAWGALSVVDSSYITTRNLEIRGDGSNTSGGNAFHMDGVEFLFAYRLEIHEIGSWNSNAMDRDVHGWRPQYRNRYLWLIDSDLYHLQADGVQCGNSSNPNPQADTNHYIYIAGNRFYENYENALDNKNSYHVVFSSNDVHDFYAAPDAGAANGTAIILSNNAEGPWTGYHWAINNRVWNTALAIRDSGSEPDERNFMIGNIVWNAETAFTQANNAANRECWIIHNAAYGATTAFTMWQPGAGSNLFVRRNVFHGGDLEAVGEINAVLDDNVLFQTTVDNTWDSTKGNSMQDPRLTDPGNGDMSLQAGSPALDAVEDDDPVFALFTSLYGLDIREDIAGTKRPQGAGWELGAIEQP